MIFQIFSPIPLFCGSFHFLDGIICSTKSCVFFYFDDVQLYTHTHTLVAVPWVFDLIFKKALPNPRSKRCTPMFQALTFSSLNPF